MPNSDTISGLIKIRYGQFIVATGIPCDKCFANETKELRYSHRDGGTWPYMDTDGIVFWHCNMCGILGVHRGLEMEVLLAKYGYCI